MHVSPMKISLSEMRLSIHQIHDCNATHCIETIKIECSRQPLSSFNVYLFEIEGHPTATQCYAWGIFINKNLIAIPAVLRSQKIFNAEQAVRSYVAD
jgi:hypothetical protein